MTPQNRTIDHRNRLPNAPSAILGERCKAFTFSVGPLCIVASSGCPSIYSSSLTATTATKLHVVLWAWLLVVGFIRITQLCRTYVGNSPKCDYELWLKCLHRQGSFWGHNLYNHFACIAFQNYRLNFTARFLFYAMWNVQGMFKSTFLVNVFTQFCSRTGMMFVDVNSKCWWHDRCSIEHMLWKTACVNAC